MAENLQIRLADPGEADRLAEIEAICFPPAEAASHEEVVKRMGAFPENFVVAVKDEQIVGFINGGTTDKPVLPDEFYHDITLHRKDGDIQTVFGLNVIPEYRHQGIAGELVEYFKELAKERGKKALILTCKEHMIPFYESHGLKKLGVWQIPVMAEQSGMICRSGSERGKTNENTNVQCRIRGLFLHS